MNSEFQRLPPETQEEVKRTMDTLEPAQTPAEIRETLEGTQKGGVKNSIRNCLTVFQRDPLFRGALRLNLLTAVSYTHLDVYKRQRLAIAPMSISKTAISWARN